MNAAARCIANEPVVTIHHDDAFAVLRTLPEHSVEAVVTDPPYALRPGATSTSAKRSPIVDMTQQDRSTEWANYAHADMLGQQSANWHKKATHSRGYADNNPHLFQRWCELWVGECLRVLKPGGHLVAFGGARTWHRLATAVEEAGFEIRDSLAWSYATGFPKSLDVGAAVKSRLQSGDQAADWTGWGTTLKPAFEPIVLARAPFKGTVAVNVLERRTGAINIDATRLTDGRWPANAFLDDHQVAYLDSVDRTLPSRFFWHAKPGQRERVSVDGVKHPTVKPLALMRELVRLVVPPGGTVLDPFAGSGTTVEACIAERVSCIAIEREAAYIPLIEARVERGGILTPGATDSCNEDDRLF